jgi:hypothetical protein
MDVVSINDLPKPQAVAALQKYRLRYFNERLSEQELSAVYDRVGGRLTFLNRVAKSRDMLETCDMLQEVEKKWFLNQCWILGAELDENAKNQQKRAVSHMSMPTPAPA